MHCLSSTLERSLMQHLYQDVSILLLGHRMPGGLPFLAIFLCLSPTHHRLTAVNQLPFPLHRKGVTSHVYLGPVTMAIHGEKNISFEPVY